MTQEREALEAELRLSAFEEDIERRIRAYKAVLTALDAAEARAEKAERDGFGRFMEVVTERDGLRAERDALRGRAEKAERERDEAVARTRVGLAAPPSRPGNP